MRPRPASAATHRRQRTSTPAPAAPRCAVDAAGSLWCASGGHDAAHGAPQQAMNVNSPMSIYAIILNSPNGDAWAKLQETWPDHHIFDDRLAFISANNALTKDISTKVGIGAEGDARGVVIQMDYFSGHTSASLVEWINKNRD